MKKKKAISDFLEKTIIEVLNIEAIANNNFSLGGGTNLAIRYNHRVSKDIDLFCPQIIGLKGYKEIQKGLETFYKSDIISVSYPANQDDQFVFLRVLIRKKSDYVKLELIQNIKNIRKIEDNNSIRMLSVLDIGIMKLLAVSDRMTKKDVFDLDFITDEIPLITIFNELKKKQELYSKDCHKSIFDISNSNNPIESPNLLLEFDSMRILPDKLKPNHLQDTLDIISENRNWYQAKYSWKMKVRKLFRELGLELPKNKGVKF